MSNELLKAAADYEAHLRSKEASWKEHTVYGLAHDGGVTLKAFVGTGIQSTDVLKKSIDKAVLDIRNVMNGGLMRDLSQDVGMNFSLYGFQCVREGTGLLIWTILSASHDVDADMIAKAEEVIKRHAKLLRR